MRYIAVGLLCGMVWLGATAEVAIVASTAIPDPNTEVMVQATGAPPGASFRWRVDGSSDGTSAPWLRFTVPAGYHVVTVEASLAGRQVGKATIALVANQFLGAVRTVRAIDTMYEVTVIVRAKVHLVAPGLGEKPPPGWAPAVEDVGNGFHRFAEEGLEVIWPTELFPGDTVSIRYLLYPPTATAVANLSGMVSGYTEDGRVETYVAGAITIP